MCRTIFLSPVSPGHSWAQCKTLLFERNCWIRCHSSLRFWPCTSPSPSAENSFHGLSFLALLYCQEYYFLVNCFESEDLPLASKKSAREPRFAPQFFHSPRFILHLMLFVVDGITLMHMAHQFLKETEKLVSVLLFASVTTTFFPFDYHGPSSWSPWRATS